MGRHRRTRISEKPSPPAMGKRWGDLVAAIGVREGLSERSCDLRWNNADTVNVPSSREGTRDT